jgi:signal peptidase I
MRYPWSRRSQSAAKEPKGLVAQGVELVVIVGVALGLALLIQAFLVKPYRIPSGSMEPTLRIGQRVLVDRIGNNFGNPSIGDVLVFHPPVGAANDTETCGVGQNLTVTNQACSVAIPKEDTSTNFIKRLVAGPGDTIFIRAGHVYRKAKGQTAFKRESDGYINACGLGDGCDLPKPIVIPPGHWFMMGDNRGASEDSRFWGSIPRSWIIGKAFFTYWPPNRIGFL